MKENRHEQIQRYLGGETSPEESSGFRQALNEDAALRALYLDYVNLDVALEVSAQCAAAGDGDPAVVASDAPAHSAGLARIWPWLAAAAAGAALIGFLILPRQRDSTPANPQMSTAFVSTQAAIARLSVEPTSPSSLFSSPTASLLNPPNSLPRNDRTP